ncbi:hypothetical protein ACFLS9_06055 [Bacteroidota bacterium]
MTKVKKRSKASKKKIISPFKNYWEKTNYYLLGLGVILLIIGFFLMAQGPWDNPISLSLSPIVLLIAYLIIFPLSILYTKKKKKNSTEDDSR